MKLKDCKDWKAVVFDDRTILKKDMKLLSKEQQNDLLEVEVTEIGRRTYKAK